MLYESYKMEFEELLDDLSSLADAHSMASRTFARDDLDRLSTMCFARMMSLIGEHRRLSEPAPKRQRLMQALDDHARESECEEPSAEPSEAAEKRPVEVEA